MFQTLLRAVVGTKNDRELKRLGPIVTRINELEAKLTPLSDAELQAKTGEFKGRIERGEPLDRLLPESFAVVREAGKRVLNMRHFDVQLLGGLVLHEGKIAEMKTGEGKTLVATLPLYLNALLARGSHLVTVNDYLARRDSEWMGKIYNFLGLSVGVIVHDLRDTERQQAYGADITYGTNNEFGFDYLRDNMKFRLQDMVQRDLHYCIVDEVDSILIDEARTPLIISGPTDDTSELYVRVNSVIPHLSKETHYTIDEKARSAMLTDAGVERVQELLGVGNLYEPSNLQLVHHVQASLKAHVVFRRDVDYVVREGEVVIVDEFTGRMMPGRRWSDGLHQAVEAKEGVSIEAENQTLATITFQNYFRMYRKLGGMTGTADTEAEEFKRIYSLDVLVMPTNRPMVRLDQHDVIYKTEAAKFQAVMEQVKECHQKGQPVLVGTISIEKSEKLSNLLRNAGVPHAVLNAKQHEREADIVAQAGQKGSVTISTNMAGRGTDIRLGEGVTQAGGLIIIGTERHESRRIDNQLRGRAGRQGDPGESRFYISLEDDLMRIFGGERLKNFMERLGMKDDEAIEHRFISKSIENAQKKVEAHNFDIRKHLLEYDDVMNQQRMVVYKRRKDILSSTTVQPFMEEMILEILQSMGDTHHEPDHSIKVWDFAGYCSGLQAIFDCTFTSADLTPTQQEGMSAEELLQVAQRKVMEKYSAKENEIGAAVFHDLERMLYLQSIDHHWKDHLLAMDHLKEGIGLRGYGQKDPLVEYKKEGFNLFTAMDQIIKNDCLMKLFRMQVRVAEANDQDPQAQERKEQRRAQLAQEELRKIEASLKKSQDRITFSSGKEEAGVKTVKNEEKVGRNDPCPCGSGKKYKKCHGA